MKNSYPKVKNCHYRISAKAILRDTSGKFALGLKEMMVHNEMQKKFDIPGGGIDHGELTPQETIKREVMEELGLKVTHIDSSPKYFFIGESTCEEIPLGLVFYETQVEHYNYTPSDECRELKFVTLEEALKEELYPAVRDFLEQAKKLYGTF